jgi:hypothetical protein
MPGANTKNIRVPSENILEKCNALAKQWFVTGIARHTGAEPSIFARARAKGSDPATKELALCKDLVLARSRAGHLCKDESVVATQSHSSPCRANLNTGCSSLQSKVLSLVDKSVR